MDSGPSARSIAIGRVVLLILVIGIAVGIYRWWQGRAPAGNTTSAGAQANSDNGTGNNGGSGANGDITVLTTATKVKWLDDEVAAFNSQNAGKYHVTRLPLMESRDAMHAILDGKSQPVVWSPSSPVWIARLNEVWAQKHNGQTIADTTDPQDYRVFLRSPLVVLTTKEKAPFLQQVFTGAHPWAMVRELSLGRKRAPWGTFRFAHADPLDASSGMLTMNLILNEYIQQTGQAGNPEQAAQSAGFSTYLTQLERRFVHDASAYGSTALEQAFLANPTGRDFITAYENIAMAAVAAKPDLAVIYPNPTSVADQSAVVLNAPWVTSAQRAGAQAFLAFLSSDQAAQDGLKYYFRPAQANTQISLASQISSYAGNGFQQTYTTVDLLPYGALNEAANQWRMNVVHRQ